MKKMIVSAMLAGTFLFGAAYAQTTTTPAAKPAEKKEVKATQNSGTTQVKEKKAHKGKKHAEKADAAAKVQK